MSPEIIGIIGIVVLLVCLASRMWIGASMALVGFLGILAIRGLDQAAINLVSQPFRQIAYNTMSVVPMFVLMGNVIAQMGIGTDMYNSAYKIVGQVRGGLAMATVFACAGLAAITGISSPALATMSKVALPEMRKYKYDEKLANGCVVSAAGLAPLIPPSLPMVMYGVLTSTSISKLFIAGLLPGVLLAVLYIVAIGIFVMLKPEAGPAGPKTSFKTKVTSLKGIWHVALLFIIVLGGIYAGVFTATEAGAIGAFGSIIIVLAMRRFTIPMFLQVLKDTVLMTAMVLLILAGAFVFIQFMAVSQLPFMLSEAIMEVNAPPMAIFAVLVVVYIILGMFMDIMSVIMLTIPIITPAMSALGFDLIWFGVILVLVLEMGLLTPPVGMDVFFFSGMSGTPVGTVFRGVVPFFIAIVVCVIILAVFPQIATFLPGSM